jgi:uncharacterized protein YggT (Ycf19 family)
MQERSINLFVAGFLLGLMFALSHFGVFLFLLVIINLCVWFKYQDDNYETHTWTSRQGWHVSWR